MISVRLRDGGKASCVVCGDQDGTLVVCPGCTTIYHPECVKECPTIGCSQVESQATRRKPFVPTKGLPHGTVARDRLRWAQQEKEAKRRRQKHAAIFCMVAFFLLEIMFEFLSAWSWSQ